MWAVWGIFGMAFLSMTGGRFPGPAATRSRGRNRTREARRGPPGTGAPSRPERRTRWRQGRARTRHTRARRARTRPPLGAQLLRTRRRSAARGAQWSRSSSRRLAPPDLDVRAVGAAARRRGRGAHARGAIEPRSPGARDRREQRVGVVVVAARPRRVGLVGRAAVAARDARAPRRVHRARQHTRVDALRVEQHLERPVELAVEALVLALDIAQPLLERGAAPARLEQLGLEGRRVLHRGPRAVLEPTRAVLRERALRALVVELRARRSELALEELDGDRVAARAARRRAPACRGRRPPPRRRPPRRRRPPPRPRSPIRRSPPRRRRSPPRRGRPRRAPAGS